MSDDVLVLAVAGPSDRRRMKRVIAMRRIGAERDEQLHHVEIAAARGVVQRAAVQTAVRDRAVDIDAELDQQLHAVRLPCLDGAMEQREATFIAQTIEEPWLFGKNGLHFVAASRDTGEREPVVASE